MDDNVDFIEKLNIKVTHLPLKRTFDIIFSLIILTLCLPIFIMIAIAVKLSSRGKIIYFHERIGRGGKTFRCYKFRTMYQDADQRLKEILLNCPSKREEWQATQKLKSDPRVTPIGQILRKTSLDELPQFLNVLKGDLSVVGPRPIVKSEIIQHFGPKATKILSIRPGITGIWQVSGRSNTSYAHRIQLDEKYVDTLSIALDLKLIIKTIPQVIIPKGAY